MTTGTVLVLPDFESRHAPLREVLLATGRSAMAITPAPGPEAALPARVCAAIASANPPSPLSILAFGSSALLLPAIALAQRAAHRRVAEYVLIDPDVPQVTDAWPDAPVTVYLSASQHATASLAALRGWSVLPIASIGEWMPAD